MTSIKLKYYTFFLLAIIIIQTKQALSQCHTNDWTALKALYENTDGDNWKDNIGWEVVKQNSPAANCDLANLFGVHLNNNGRVFCLDFDGINNCQWDGTEGNNLNGSLPSELGMLESLTLLYLRKNQITGNIPPEMGNLNNLSFLELSYNQLNGSIPVEMGNLSKLEYLNVGLNNLSGIIPPSLSKLSNLTELHLWSNQLSGNIPPELGNLNLTNLQLNGNNLDGCYPENLSSFCSISNNYFGNQTISNGNNFDATWADFCSSNAGICTLSNPKCHIDDWTALKAIYESTQGDNWTNNSGWEIILEDSPPANCNLANLHGVQLNSEGKVYCLDFDGTDDCLWSGSNGNQLNGNIPPEIGLLINLEKMFLNKNQLSGALPPEISYLKKMKNMSFYKNQLSGNIPPELGDLCSLKYLSLGENKLSGSLPPELGNLSNLVRLGISNNPDLSGSIPSELGNLSQLKSLDLDANQLTGSIPAELNQLSNLENLSLSNNRLSGSIPTEFINLSQLTVLNFSHNQLTGNIPPIFSNLENLVELKLSGNQLEGSIPFGIGSLINLTILRLEYNNLSDSIPTQLGNLNKLVELRLNRNQLDGSIPIALSNLTNLNSIELDYNKLSGNIPPGFGNLSQLTYLTLHDNRLNGAVPLFSQTALTMHLYNNYFSCSDIQNHFNINQQMAKFTYSPQYFSPLNYDAIKATTFDAPGQSLTIAPELSLENMDSVNYQWKRNQKFISGANNNQYSIESIQSSNAGKYFLHIFNENCLPDEHSLELISDPIYVILKGYDFHGRQVVYDQIMVQFENKAVTTTHEDEILFPKGGWVKDQCNCNREIYLWQFPSTETALAALLAIDEKTKIIKRKNTLKGGFNNNLSIGKQGSSAIAHNITSTSFSKNYPDSVKVFIIDSGLDEQNYNAAPFLYDQASVDICYDIEKASGYSYTDTTVTLSTNYTDDLWHGTFGFHSITADLEENAKLKLVPLKVFNKNGTGNLFDMVCSIYHAIDHKANIINISAGYQGDPSDILESAINSAREKGIFITAAAGNDTLNIDIIPQYPAYYAGQYYKFDTIDASGNIQLDSVKYDHVISVASIHGQDSLSQFSNYGKQSVTLATYGENIHSYGLEGLDVVASGSSMATYFATKALALEIARDNKRNYKTIWNDFEINWLENNPSLLEVTQTGKHINFTLEAAIIEGCTDETNCHYFPFATMDDDSCLPAFINLLNLTNEIYNAFHASDSIISNSLIEPFDSISYIAGKLISLEEGFNIQKGAEFIADIQACD